MAIYVLLLKESEDDTTVIYRFGPHQQKLGCLALTKSDGSVTQLQPAPTQHPQAYFMRAATKVRQHWRQGSFPETSCWAS